MRQCSSLRSCAVCLAEGTEDLLNLAVLTRRRTSCPRQLLFTFLLTVEVTHSKAVWQKFPFRMCISCYVLWLTCQTSQQNVFMQYPQSRYSFIGIIFPLPNTVRRRPIKEGDMVLFCQNLKISSTMHCYCFFFLLILITTCSIRDTSKHKAFQNKCSDRTHFIRRSSILTSTVWLMECQYQKPWMAL